MICIILITVISNRLPEFTKHKISSDKLPKEFEDFKIIQLSDLHSAEFGKNNSALLKKIQKSDPDIVVLTGDMISTSDENYEVFFTLAEKLAADFDTYFTVGNHEQALGDKKRDMLCAALEAKGIKVLDNESILIERGGSHIQLYGLWFNLRYYTDRSEDAPENEQYYFETKTMYDILGAPEADTFTILITHNPVYFNTYTQWGADLTLCGHMHGGMIRLPFLGGLFSPEKNFFPEYDAGIFENGEKYMVVSRGLGNGSMGFRFLNRPEIVEIKLSQST